MYLESQYELKARKYGRHKCLRISGFEVRQKETKEECESIVKIHITNT